jgi:hypothetical protein
MNLDRWTGVGVWMILERELGNSGVQCEQRANGL